MGGGAVLHGRPVRTWAAGPGATRYRQGRHPARRTQLIGVVAAVELTSCKVPGRHEYGAGIRGRRHDGRRSLRTERPVARGGASDRWQAADFEQLEPERLDLREHAIQRGAVGQRPGQHGVAAAGLSL